MSEVSVGGAPKIDDVKRVKGRWAKNVQAGNRARVRSKSIKNLVVGLKKC